MRRNESRVLVMTRSAALATVKFLTRSSVSTRSARNQRRKRKKRYRKVVPPRKISQLSTVFFQTTLSSSAILSSGNDIEIICHRPAWPSKGIGQIYFGEPGGGRGMVYAS